MSFSSRFIRVHQFFWWEGWKCIVLVFIFFQAFSFILFRKCFFLSFRYFGFVNLDPGWLWVKYEQHPGTVATQSINQSIAHVDRDLHWPHQWTHPASTGIRKAKYCTVDGHNCKTPLNNLQTLLEHPFWISLHCRIMLRLMGVGIFLRY